MFVHVLKSTLSATVSVNLQLYVVNTLTGQHAPDCDEPQYGAQSHHTVQHISSYVGQGLTGMTSEI